VAMRMAKQSKGGGRAGRGEEGERGAPPRAVAPAHHTAPRPLSPALTSLSHFPSPFHPLAAHLLQNEDEIPGQHIGGVAACLAAKQHLGAVAVAGLNVHLQQHQRREVVKTSA
jgi:hypothetical protein